MPYEPLRSGEEEDKARAYRSEWDAKISFRANMMRRMAGSLKAWELLWERFRPIYDKTNYIEPTQLAGVPPTFDDGSYVTPYDIDDNGAISSSPVRLRNARHAGDQNDRPHGA